MLRINVHNGGKGYSIELAGRLVGPWVEELRGLCLPLLGKDEELRVNLAQVSYVAPEGAALLLQLQAQRVGLSNCTRFVAEQLRTAASIQNRGNHE